MPNAFFTTVDGIWFSPTEHTRGPWDVNACHAGPPTGLLARSLEQLQPDKRLLRLSVDLIRPIAFDGFRIESETIRAGRSVATTKAALIGENGKTLASAQALHMIEQKHQDLPTHRVQFAPPSLAKPGPFPIQTLHEQNAFNGTGVEIRYPDGESDKPGPTTVWMKTVPLLENEIPSGFQRICPLADCGNAFGRNADPSEVSFINPDLTIVLHRDPVGEWLGSQSVGYWEPNGQGLADAQLFDEVGVVGRAMQTLLLHKK